MNNYFSHDSNARNSDKLIPLRSEMGAEGYGIYFMLLERLREEPDYTSVKDYNMLAFDLRVDAAKIKRVIEGFRLFVFTEDGKYFYSEGFCKRMNHKDEKSEKARQSVLKKWGCSAGSNINAVTRSQRLAAARAIATHTAEEWQEMKDFFGHCVICGKSAENEYLVKDHVIPLYQGGDDGITNLQPLCRSCNSRKGPDSTDYRLIYCTSNHIEMPTKWLPNAYETPAIKERKVKESKEKKNKFFSQCAPAGCYPLSAEEKEKIFEIFFFSNLQNPDGELSAYIDHNTALGWMCGSSPISDKVAYAKGWVKKKTEKEANVTPRFPAPFLAQYRLFCDALQAERVDLLPVFLHGLYGLKIEQKKLMLICSAEMAKTLKTDDMVRQAFTENVLAGKFAGYDLSCVKPTIGQTER